MRVSGFRLKNKKLLLTYPHSDYEENDLLDKFLHIVNGNIINYAIVCREHHEDGSYHNHIYVEFNKAYESRNPRCFDIEGRHPNIQIIKATPWKTVDYVKKEGDWVEYHPENAPRLNYDSMTRSEKFKFLRDNDPIELYDKCVISAESCMRMIKAKEFISNYRKLTRTSPPIVLWFYGPTGTGKTRTAIELAEESGHQHWISNDPDLKWFDGYHGQEYAIIDDFRRHGIKFSWVLRLLDRYPLLVQVKGGYVRWTPLVIIVTSPVCAKEAYQYMDKDGELQEWDGIEQLLRRIDQEIEFK